MILTWKMVRKVVLKTLKFTLAKILDVFFNFSTWKLFRYRDNFLIKLKHKNESLLFRKKKLQVW